MNSSDKKYDIAISLCKQDVDFAKKLVSQLNPSLSVFFYENNQEELINKMGPEVFARTFKEQSRIVVILSRNEWSKTVYTEIEANAIIEKFSKDGYGFLFVIPMEPNQIPAWYPSIRIYADPRRFTIEDLAKFIEFKVSEEGGNIKQLTVEDRYQNLLDKIDAKKYVIELQQNEEAIAQANNEIKILKDCFNQKIKFLQQSIFDGISMFLFSEHVSTAHFGIGHYLLECKVILPDRMYHRIVTTQDFCISFELYKIFGKDESRKLIEQEQRLFYYNPPLNGWASPFLHEQATKKEIIVLFRNRDNSQFYDLINPANTVELVDMWFQKLLNLSTQNIEKYL